MVVDERGEEVEPGEVGEFLVRAPTMMQGYWGQPKLSEQAILTQEPFPGFRKQYYRTGDLVSLRPDALLTFRGRKDRQVKVRGYRVELDEIEAVCNAVGSVVEAAALPLRDDEGSVEIIAVVQVPRRGGGRYDDSAAGTVLISPRLCGAERHPRADRFSPHRQRQDRPASAHRRIPGGKESLICQSSTLFRNSLR